MKILVFSDLPAESGFGRISIEVAKRLQDAGHQIVGASIMYSGMHPHQLPFFIAPLAEHDIWVKVTEVVNSFVPDVVICCQDFPYAETLYRACRIDWSKHALINITPVDGTPIRKDWLELTDELDATLVISRFGVEAMRQAGRRVSLCHPGVDVSVFHPASAEEQAELRAKAGIAPDAFVLGMMAMNQGRKNVPATLAGFFEFAKDKPEARILLDMDKLSPGGWDILKDICAPEEYDASKILWREDLQKRGLINLRDRYCLLDAHSVLAFREGFGLPLLESMACGVPAIAQAWCSGTEIVGDGKGVLIPTMPYPRPGTWGGARDFDPDLPAFIAALNRLYYEPAWRQSVAATGLAWAKQQTWDNAFVAVVDAIHAAVAHHKGAWKDMPKKETNEPVNHHPGIQPIAAPAALPGVAHADGDGAGGTDPGGRREHGVRPADAAHAYAGNPPQRAEHGLRVDVQQGRERGNGEAAAVPELGHAGAAGLDGAAHRGV